jgi:hypothetical protein
VLHFVLPESGQRFLDSIERFGSFPIILAFYFLGPFAAAFGFRFLRATLLLAFGGEYTDTMLLTWWAQ